MLLIPGKDFREFYIDSFITIRESPFFSGCTVILLLVVSEKGIPGNAVEAFAIRQKARNKAGAFTIGVFKVRLLSDEIIKLI